MITNACSRPDRDVRLAPNRTPGQVPTADIGHQMTGFCSENGRIFVRNLPEGQFSCPNYLWYRSGTSERIDFALWGAQRCKLIC